MTVHVLIAAGIIALVGLLYGLSAILYAITRPPCEEPRW